MAEELRTKGRILDQKTMDVAGNRNMIVGVPYTLSSSSTGTSTYNLSDLNR